MAYPSLRSDGNGNGGVNMRPRSRFLLTTFVLLALLFGLGEQGAMAQFSGGQCPGSGCPNPILHPTDLTKIKPGK